MGAERFGLSFGEIPSGETNRITDVPGVLVGHKTLCSGDIQTGVTAVLPHGGNLFREKVPAAVHVINGFGKTVGSIQMEELGTLETPIVLTNTLSVGTASTALIRYMLNQCPEIGDTSVTLNPVVCECNDMRLNDIRGLHIGEPDVLDALHSAGKVFAEGAVGAGRGMCCFQLKGGIGSASRRLVFDGIPYTLGCLVLTNFGAMKDFLLCGAPVGSFLAKNLSPQEDKGSCIVVLATDLPLSTRQLKRIARRAGVGISRTGGLCSNGSGEIALAFSTTNRIPHEPGAAVRTCSVLAEEKLDEVFRAAAFATEESIVSSMLHAETVTGRGGVTVKSLLDEYPGLLREFPQLAPQS